MTVVKFNQPEEFIEELGKDAHATSIVGDRAVMTIKDRIVRVTSQSKSSSLSPNIRYIIILATYERASGQIVRLEHFCGETWAGVGGEVNEKTKERANEVGDLIRQAGAAQGLDVRAGVIEPVEAAA